MQCVLLLVDTGAELTLIYGKPDCFIGSTTCKEGYGSHCVTVWMVQVILGIGCLPLCPYDVYDSLVTEYILGEDMLS